MHDEKSIVPDDGVVPAGGFPPALAAEDLTGRPLADGVVSAVHYLDVTAPMGAGLAECL